MAKTADNVTWVQLAILIPVSLAIVGGAFVWLRSDVSDLKTEVVGVRNQITGVRNEVSAVREEVAKTNGKLDTLIRLTRDKKK